MPSKFLLANETMMVALLLGYLIFMVSRFLVSTALNKFVSIIATKSYSNCSLNWFLNRNKKNTIERELSGNRYHH